MLTIKTQIYENNDVMHMHITFLVYMLVRVNFMTSPTTGLAFIMQWFSCFCASMWTGFILYMYMYIITWNFLKNTSTLLSCKPKLIWLLAINTQHATFLHLLHWFFKWLDMVKCVNWSYKLAKIYNNWTCNGTLGM